MPEAEPSPAVARKDCAAVDNRRAEEIVLTETTAALFASLVGYAGLPKRFPPDTTSQVHKLAAGYDQEKPQHLIDQTHTLKNGALFRNLGVMHDERSYRTFQGHLHTAIDACDVLLTEHSPADFFGPCERHALKQGKPVYGIDEHDRRLLEAAISLEGAGAIGLAVDAAFGLYRKQKRGISMRAWTTRRNFLRALTVGGLGVALFTGASILETKVRKPTDCKGFLTRGRTASMLAQSLAIAQDPRKRYLLLTGDNHAEIIEQYFEHPEILEEDLRNFRAQFAVFGQGSRQLKT